MYLSCFTACCQRNAHTLLHSLLMFQMQPAYRVVFMHAFAPGCFWLSILAIAPGRFPLIYT
jgi:hypothetical protein